MTLSPALRRVRDGAVAAVLGFALCLAAISANELRARDEDEVLGALDFFGYCDAVYGTDATAVNLSSSAYGWNCAYREPIYTLESINVDQACALLYGTPSTARVNSDDPAHGWTCLER